MKTLPQIVIFGRTNTGKSTLFNRLIEQPKALTSSSAGTTRDTNIAPVFWQGFNFELVDTGGLETIYSKKKLQQAEQAVDFDLTGEIVKRTQAALKKADAILFIVDIQAGLMPQDRDLAQALKKMSLDKKIVLAANKTDSLRYQNRVAEFYKLGLGEPLLVSGQTGLGTGDLLDLLVNKLKKLKKIRKSAAPNTSKALKITIIGKPNVGKSSLLNAILGENRVIVSPVPFTTRESIDTNLIYKDQLITLIDTAGIRKQAHIASGLEKTAVKRGLENTRNSDICLLVLDISQPITTQDNKLSDLLLQTKSSIIIIANKWDLIPDKTTNTINKFQNYIYRFFPYLTWAPIIFISAKNNQHVPKVLDEALNIYKQRQQKISTSALNKFLKSALKGHRPSQARGKPRAYLYGLTQVKTNPPRFTIKMNKHDIINPTYIRYLENSLRRKFKLEGTPTKIDLEQA